MRKGDRAGSLATPGPAGSSAATGTPLFLPVTLVSKATAVTLP